MIKRAILPEELTLLPQKGIEAQKIRALLLAYGTKYDFCRFYVSDNFILCEMNGSFVVCETGSVSNVSELAEFFVFNGFSEIFCSEDIGGSLRVQLNCSAQKVDLMRFYGEPVKCAEVECEPPLDEVFKILSSSFDIGYEQWYVDMSHRIRHNVAKARKLGSSALMIQHDLNCEALLSQIATLPNERGHGNASQLISSVCAELSQSNIYVICEEKLRLFYQRIGFEKTADKFIITKDL